MKYQTRHENSTLRTRFSRRISSGLVLASVGIPALVWGSLLGGCDEPGDDVGDDLESSAILCFDDVDNDGDGAVDCGDSECSGFCAEVKPEVVSAALNGAFDFDSILFIKRDFIPTFEHQRGGHMCDQYHGFNAPQGGGLFILDGAMTGSPTVRNVLASSVVENGRFQGQRLEGGSFLSPDLSYDATEILFAWTEAGAYTPEWNETNTHHIFKVRVDGTGLRQLTDGPYNDFDPVWLPDGRIAFISDRRGGYGRCHPRPVPSYTLHVMNADGSRLKPISLHETNEWHPSVDNHGMIVFTRWDYVDRGENQMHGPWLTSPDGHDARPINLSYPDDEGGLPRMIMDMRAIPGSNKYVGTAAGHHAQAYGSLLLIDPDVEDDDHMGPIVRITEDARFPEGEVMAESDNYYATAWPLSEDYFLCVHDPDFTARSWTTNYGIYLIDRQGNKQLLYRDPEISALSPIPLKPRSKPVPVSGLVDDENPPEEALVSVMNVYDSLLPFPDGTEIVALRIVQLLPKSTPLWNEPRTAYDLNRNTRQVLGTVPVEADGSAYFYLPVDIPVYFQALDENGLAVQSMRSDAFVPRGQKLLVCQGCHEPRHRAPANPASYPAALLREPSEIAPDVEGANPFSYAQLVQPVFDANCVSCHATEGGMDLSAAPVEVGWRDSSNVDIFFASYRNLTEGGYAFFYDTQYHVAELGHAYAYKDPPPGQEFYGYPRTVPGAFGAKAAKLYQILEAGHNNVQLSQEEMHRIALWLDLTSPFLGVYHDVEAQLRGETVAPILE